MKRILLLLLICTGFTASAQEVYTSSGKPSNAKKRVQKEKGFDPSKLIFGGGLQLGFGNITSISVSPIVGYRLTDNLAVGIGLGYQYLKIKDYFPIEDASTGQVYLFDYKSSIISTSVWSRYLITPSIFANVEYEHNFMSFQDYRYSPTGSGAIEGYKVKYQAPCLLLGAGWRQEISDNASMFIMVMYDVIQDKYSPYKDRIMPRVGFNIGF
jgi:hypothetical protein